MLSLASRNCKLSNILRDDDRWKLGQPAHQIKVGRLPKRRTGKRQNRPPHRRSRSLICHSFRITPHGATICSLDVTCTDFAPVRSRRTFFTGLEP